MNRKNISLAIAALGNKSKALLTARNKDIRRNFAMSERKISLQQTKKASSILKDEDIRHQLALATEKMQESYGILNRTVIERTADLKESYEKLEQKVFERTQELENANAAIQNVMEDLNDEKIKLEELQAKDESILLSIGEGLLACDEKGKIIITNKAAEEMLGWKKSEILGKDFFKYITAENEAGQVVSLGERPLRNAIITATSTYVTVGDPAVYYVRKDKTRFSVSINVTPIILNGKVIGAVDVFRDITHEKQVDQAKSEFVSLASHQLRTPLTYINWYTELILDGDAGQITPGQKDYLERINVVCKGMVEMVNNFLNISRIEMGTFKDEPKLIDIVELANKVIDEQNPKIITKNLDIIKNFRGYIPKLHVDAELLGMVFQNILSNAIKYTPDDGKIKFIIFFDKDGDKNIHIEVSDTGYGIPKEQQSQMFTKLFRADNVIGKKIEGTGLGLYIVKYIVENYGGKIWFKSKQDKGSTFYMSFPMSGTKKK